VYITNSLLLFQGSHVICVHTCPVCKDSGKIHLHGDNWHPSNDSCMNCKCEVSNAKDHVLDGYMGILYIYIYIYINLDVSILTVECSIHNL
jgi:hypothetical protein